MLRVVPFDSIVVPGSRSVLFDRVQRKRRGSPNPIARLDGLWKGRLHDEDGERHVPFAIPNSPPITLDLLEASTFAYVVVTEPYTDPFSRKLVLTSFEGRWARNRLWGAYLTRPLGGGEAVIGRFSAVKAEIAGW